MVSIFSPVLRGAGDSARLPGVDSSKNMVLRTIIVRNPIYLDMVVAMSGGGSPGKQLADDLRDALVQTSFALMAVLTEVAAEHDLSLTQLRVLGIMRDREPTMGELASYTGLERSTVSGLIERAAARGLVVKTADENDGRAVRVNLTTGARRLERETTKAIEQRIAPMLGRLSTREQQRLAALLSKTLER
ncbi:MULTISPECIES: MarR family winged helix-turn-helix transcriptional regulator [Mycobacterium]|nr:MULTISPECIES: MarR family transcriptional regulator [Mycobacterium]MDC8975258.1 MarR family transcriptional regulator [Mycobacterium marinum]